ncbi:hypothetical protein PPL_04698 [Heterostelium album PN500]|uniref:Uncharacterized protein n=1 Tax=Heterostelium pallidum (strain ATCC 26659 / Pp 5 / PN500) TaxID=670386 RepID=D3B8A7_HETP5|nr:hypothetical protein PPL_04698 [Heterostelium album PN500]EFA82275.1 hypothetical protein PPL_04698 [Heterostelium album PN500]|eukprot:XP_020434392.1 hypothetical protein PPL_04698 [Heterostelium album PN500]
MVTADFHSNNNTTTKRNKYYEMLNIKTGNNYPTLTQVVECLTVLSGGQRFDWTMEDAYLLLNCGYSFSLSHIPFHSLSLKAIPFPHSNKIVLCSSGMGTGVAIIKPKGADLDYKEIFSDPGGRILFVTINHSHYSFNVLGIYAPADRKRRNGFSRQLSLYLSSKPTPSI